MITLAMDGKKDYLVKYYNYINESKNRYTEQKQYKWINNIEKAQGMYPGDSQGQDKSDAPRLFELSLLSYERILLLYEYCRLFNNNFISDELKDKIYNNIHDFKELESLNNALLKKENIKKQDVIDYVLFYDLSSIYHGENYLIDILFDDKCSTILKDYFSEKEIISEKPLNDFEHIEGIEIEGYNWVRIKTPKETYVSENIETYMKLLDNTQDKEAKKELFKCLANPNSRYNESIINIINKVNSNSKKKRINQLFEETTKACNITLINTIQDHINDINQMDDDMFDKLMFAFENDKIYHLRKHFNSNNQVLDEEKAYVDSEPTNKIKHQFKSIIHRNKK